jgi:protein TonB
VSAATLEQGSSLKLPIVASAGLHIAFLAVLLLSRSGNHAPSAPTYRVNLVAAPPGERQIGVVQPPTAAPVTTAPTPPPVARETPVKAKGPAKAKPVPKPKVATPNAAPAKTAPAATTPQPVAGGGPQGGRGADVANVNVQGITFPFPAYLQNIVRQIAIQFKPANRTQSAEVAFIIRRDGTVAGLRLTRRSSVYSFDQDALAAVELASKAFGPLPAEFADDALPVIFTFDPRIIR